MRQSFRFWLVFLILAAATLALAHRVEPLAFAPSPHAEAGAWLRANAHPGDTVVAYEVGTVAYLSELRTIDLLGLTEPEALPFVKRGDYAWAIRMDHPEYVFTPERSSWSVIASIYAEPYFAQNYKVVARFAFRPGLDYLLYQRSELPS